jgi:hypothetical protein
MSEHDKQLQRLKKALNNLGIDFMIKHIDGPLITINMMLGSRND